MVWCTFSSCPLISKFKHMQVRWRGNVKLNVFVSERCKYLDYTGSEAAKKTDKLTFNRGDDWIKLHVFHPHLLVTALTQESPESPAIRSSFWTEQGDDWFTKKKKKRHEYRRALLPRLLNFGSGCFEKCQGRLLSFPSRRQTRWHVPDKRKTKTI